MPTGVYTRRSLLERFSEKYLISTPNECWIWLGAKDSSGYGQISNNHKRVGAHRIAWEIANSRKLYDDEVIDHLCRNPSCVNPAHLEAVSMKENTARGNHLLVIKEKSKNRTHCKRGHLLSEDNIAFSSSSKSCKMCQKIKAREWKIRNKDLVNERQRFRRKINKEALS